MATADQIIAAARRELGTPFHHQGREPGVGIDCIGLLVLTARACGIPIEDRRAYAREPKSAELLAELDAQLDRISLLEFGAGDVLAFWMRDCDQPKHVGIATPHPTAGLALIHTYDGGQHRVVEHVIGEAWRARLYGAWRFRGLAA